MSATALFRDHKPLDAYHRGQARLMRERLTGNSAPWLDPLNRMRRDLIATSRQRGKPPRQEAIDGIIRAWKQLPLTGQLNFQINRTRTTLEVADTRMVREKFHRASRWDGPDEPAIVAGIYRLRIKRDQVVSDMTTVATIGLFCLGVRLIAADPSDQAVLADIAALVVTARTQLDHPDGPFAIVVPAGEWLGERASFHDPVGHRHPGVAHARSFRT
jgi:hypothetical protein